ncbi:DNA repair protein RecO [Candidatus Dojkabacteria bacterium]|nr:DNA repair protein RecO [Candidatus Dojkabacteria bacterium]
MRTHRDQIVILKSNNYSEADKILTVFGREFGKFSILAKGMRRLSSKNRGNMQTLSIADISFYKAQGLALLLESKSVHIPDFTTIEVKNSTRVLRLISRLIPDEQAYVKIYEALVKAIKSDLTTDLTNRFRLLFLIEEGLINSMHSCGICGAPDGLNHLQLSIFVLLCENCYSSKKWSTNDVIAVNGELYSNTKFTIALDKYIDNLLLEMT